MTSKTLSEDASVKEGKTATGHKKENDVGKENKSYKVYSHRNSVLTDLMELNHLQSVYNICVAVCILLMLNAVLYYLAAPHKFQADIQLMSWASGKIPVFLALWFSLNALSFIVYQGFRVWLYCRHVFYKKIVDFAFLISFTSVCVFMFVVTPYFVRKRELGPITAFAILSEQVRIFMKVYSFVRENVPRALKYNPVKDGNQMHHVCPPVRHFIYYMFAPALIYRDTYPRTSTIHWDFVITSFLKFFGCIFITYCMFHRFIVDIFEQVGMKRFTLPELALTFAGCMLVGSLIMFLVFYGILHCWLNAFAELMKFGDRLFYTDWWNSTSYSQYYRRWNLIVYDWLYTYIYMDFYKIGLPKLVSMMSVFIISAVVHEYVISVAFGFFFPVLATAFCGIGVPLVFVTKSKTSQPWNTFMWIMQFSGWGVLVFLYSAEWYARKNCPQLIDGTWDFFVPRLRTCKLT